MFDFTRAEKVILVFLTVTFICGICIKVYRENWQPLPAVAVEPAAAGEEKEQTADAVSGNGNEGDEARLKGRININTASRSELEEIPGIGPVTADRIVTYREVHGGFSDISELDNVSGIGKKTIEKISIYIQI